MSLGRHRAVALAVVLAMGIGSSARAEVPTEMAMVLMLKVVTYDPRFVPESREDFLVLIPYVATQKQLADDTLKALDSVAASKLGARKVKLKLVPADELGKSIEADKAAALVLLPDSPRALAEAQRAEGTKHKLYMLALSPTDVVAHHSMISVAEEAGRPKIVLDVKLAKAAGIELSPTVLRIARVVP